MKKLYEIVKLEIFQYVFYRKKSLRSSDTKEYVLIDKVTLMTLAWEKMEELEYKVVIERIWNEWEFVGRLDGVVPIQYGRDTECLQWLYARSMQASQH